MKDTRREKHVERDADVFMSTLGFAVIRFSQSRATMQTPGIPDRLYINAAKARHVFYEAKKDGGRQSVHQKQFQGLCEALGWLYLVGTDAVLHEWALGEGLVERIGSVGFRRLDLVRDAGRAGAP